VFAPLSTAVHTLTLDSASRRPKLAEQTGLALREKSRDISTAVRLRPSSRLPLGVVDRDDTPSLHKSAEVVLDTRGIYVSPANCATQAKLLARLVRVTSLSRALVRRRHDRFLTSARIKSAHGASPSAYSRLAQSLDYHAQSYGHDCSDSQRARRTAHRSDSCSHVSRRCAADPAPRDLSFRRSAQNLLGHRRGAFQRCAHALQRYDALSKFSESRFLAHPPPAHNPVHNSKLY